MYNTKLNKVYKDVKVQKVLEDLAVRCEKDGILCKAWGKQPMKCKEGGSTIIPSLLIGESCDILEPYFDRYEDLICDIVEEDSEMSMTVITDPIIASRHRNKCL